MYFSTSLVLGKAAGPSPKLRAESIESVLRGGGPVRGNNRVYVIVPFLAFIQWKIVSFIYNYMN